MVNISSRYYQTWKRDWSGLSSRHHPPFSTFYDPHSHFRWTMQHSYSSKKSFRALNPLYSPGFLYRFNNAVVNNSSTFLCHLVLFIYLIITLFMYSPFSFLFTACPYTRLWMGWQEAIFNTLLLLCTAKKPSTGYITNLKALIIKTNIIKLISSRTS